KDFQSIDRKILEGVDYIVPLDQEKTASKPSRIIKIDRDGAIEIIRE
ncbi:MAG: translation factor Sua5, partial [Flavobacteriaceae bacterium]|nr:translation factor Sua5 [Flavobacteriaceae bacterium]